MALKAAAVEGLAEQRRVAREALTLLADDEWTARVFSRYLAQVGAEGLKPVLDGVAREYLGGKDGGMRTMAEAWLAQGARKGVRVGERKATRKSLLTVLTSRFGEVPPAVASKVSEAGLKRLETWLAVALEAPSLDAVFGERD